ncbi:unnamed protein product [Ambrosiozyma monospora]|uniref:Unnamed protein product n=1 Tax=Ambrosiozyma monospora TaxID=43982 RepID=A0A9W7DD66_AMBMO|nr:unnamed protein product [Ambrosiozyma monospora]
MSRIKSHWRNKSKSAVDTEITDIPILEDDEENNELIRPVLPNFSSTSNIHNHPSHKPKQASDDLSSTASRSNDIPIPKPTERGDSKGLSDFDSSDVFTPADSAKNIRREIDDDFDADFDRDAGVGIAIGLPSTTSLGSAPNIVSPPGEVKRGTRIPMFNLGDSSSDESTDEEVQEYEEQDITEQFRGDNSLNRKISNKSNSSDLHKGVSLRDRLKRRFTISGHRQGSDDDIEKQVGSDVHSNDNHSSVSVSSGRDGGSSIHRHLSIFNKLLNPDVNVGMTPAAPGNGIMSRRAKPLDEEAAMESRGDYAPHIDEEQLRNEAKGIVSQHFGAMNMSSSTLATDSIPTHRVHHGHTDSSAFLTNDDILNDEFDDVRRDLNLADFDVPESAFKHKRVKKGIASALMGLYNRPSSTGTTIYTPSVISSGTVTPASFMDAGFDPDELKSKLNKIGSVDSNSKLNVPTKASGHRRSSSFGLSLAKMARSKSTEDSTGKKVKFENTEKSAFPDFSRIRTGTKEGELDLNSYDIDDDDYEDFDEKAGYSEPPQDTASIMSSIMPTRGNRKPRNKASTTGSNNKKKFKLKKRKFKKETAARITVHIADVLQRQRFILLLCKTLMLYGAPTHRLEEYMSMTSQVLEIDGSFIYIPGTMIVSFGDAATRTTDMKLVRCAQGLDLSKLDETYAVYKAVVHDRIGVIDASEQLEAMLKRKPKFNAWICVLFYAFASACVGPWAFGSSWIDIPICFGVGLVIGFLQFILCPRSSLYSCVFEVTASIVCSFICRALGSITRNGESVFCYAALVQSSLALILPGYIILCGSLELQSRNLVAGSVRMFYAFIYSLMLSFVGTDSFSFPCLQFV